MLSEKAKEIVKGVESKMEDTVAFLEEDLKTYRVGKANPSILNNVTVSYYGTDTPVSQVASVSVPDARTITIQPWERSLIPAIEKAIMAANLGFTPQNNGEIIRCPIPPLTEERRKDLIKKAKAAGESAKVAVRNIRREEGREGWGLHRGRTEGRRGRNPEGDRRQGEGHRRPRFSQGKRNIDRLVDFFDFFLSL